MTSATDSPGTDSRVKPLKSSVAQLPVHLVRIVLMHDKSGLLQVILPGDWLLDLKSLHAQTNRELLALTPAELVTATRNESLKPLENVPGFFLLPTVFDESVAICSHCDIEIAEVDNRVRETLEVSALKTSLQSHDFRVTTIKCCLPPEKLPAPASFVSGADADLQLITESLQNFTALRIKQRLDETLEIPPLPLTAQRIIKLRSNPDATVKELTDIVEDDASLAAQVVSWAASPYYAAPGKIQSVQDAIVRVLGFDLVSNLALGLAMGKTLTLPKDRVAGITPYWLQSVYCSTAVESIVRQMPARHRPSAGIAYLSGLLHNFGYLVLAHTFPPHFSAICRYVEANPAISHVAIESLLLGITREQIGALLMNLWRMPAEVSVALRYQHDPQYSGEHSVYPHLIYIALRLLRLQGIGDAPLEEIPDNMFERYGLDPLHVSDAVQLVIDSPEIRIIAENFPR